MASKKEETAAIAAAATDVQDRYRSVFLAALTGFTCNPSLGSAKWEELAAVAAQRTVERGLDLHSSLRPEE